jgi:hypothetical protein
VIEMSVSAPTRVAALDPKGNASLWTGSDWKALQAPVGAQGKSHPLKGIAITPSGVWGIATDNFVWQVAF